MTDEARDEAIARAATAFREESHGRSDAARQTRARILATRRAQTQRSALWLAAAAALILGLGVPTAWAWSTGRLATWLGAADTDASSTDRSGVDRSDTERASADPSDIHHAQLDPSDLGPAVVDPSEIDHGLVDPSDTPHAVPLDSETDHVRVSPSAVEHSPIDRSPIDRSPIDHSVLDRSLSDHSAIDHAARDDAATDPSAVDPAGPAGSEGDGSTDETIDPEERLAFERADSLHTARDAAAIGAWDAYLARYPDGRFAIEARYARALCLVRLGRTDDARDALAPFAAGRYGRYREREASALIEALGP